MTGDQTLLLKHTLSVTLNCVVIASAMHFRKKNSQEDDTVKLINNSFEAVDGAVKNRRNKDKKKNK